MISTIFQVRCSVSVGAENVEPVPGKQVTITIEGMVQGVRLEGKGEGTSRKGWCRELNWKMGHVSSRRSDWTQQGTLCFFSSLLIQEQM